MLHVVPIVCILLFFGFVEYRLSKEVKELHDRIDDIEQMLL